MEKFMKELCGKPDRREYYALMLACFFWQVVDFIFHTNKAKLFKHLYMTPSCFDETYLKISMDFNVSVRTLERYRKLYVLSFEAALSLLNTNIILFNVA